jgi:nitrite reductase/ring-hydroxylating ferredoxin subunit
MASFIKVAKVTDLPEGTGKLVEADGKQIALFNAGGKFFAIDNASPARGTAGNMTSRPAPIWTTRASSSDATR